MRDGRGRPFGTPNDSYLQPIIAISRYPARSAPAGGDEAQFASSSGSSDIPARHRIWALMPDRPARESRSISEAEGGGTAW
jgi:hypothetical protein